MKSNSYLKLGNWNLRGKKSKIFWAGKYIEDVVHDFRDREHIREINKEIRSLK